MTPVAGRAFLRSDTHPLTTLARRFGHEHARVKKPRDPLRQLVMALQGFTIDTVIDVGANRGQYGRALRTAGWGGPLLSIEPQPALQAELRKIAARHPPWVVGPAVAVGAHCGTATLERSAESDMSSLLPQTPTLQTVSPSSAVAERMEVPLRRLDSLEALRAAPHERLFLKLDLQGGEAAALTGAEGLLPRVVGLQVEMALVPMYEGEADWRSTVDRLAVWGYELYLLIPGYFERKLMRQVQVDGIFFKGSALRNSPPSAEGGAGSVGGR